jgi:hypothetical protein
VSTVNASHAKCTGGISIMPVFALTGVSGGTPSTMIAVAKPRTGDDRSRPAHEPGA